MKATSIPDESLFKIKGLPQEGSRVMMGGKFNCRGLVMQKGHTLLFHCQSCKQPVRFSIFHIEQHPMITCESCHKKYSFLDEVLKRQLKKFEALCRQIIDAEEILSNTSVGIDVGDRHVKIPYKLLLTRLSSSLELKINGQPLNIDFRLEPLSDFPQNLIGKHRNDEHGQSKK